VLAVMAKLLAKHIGDAASAMRGADWTSTFRVHRRLADAYRRGRMLLAGDAAHIHGPVGGQGMNTGMGDAENLAWKLALVVGKQADETLLDTYEAERRPVAAGVVRTVGGIERLLLSRNPMVAFLREQVMLPMVNRPEVQRLVWQKSSQLGITYCKGPLAQRPARKIHGRRSGDRVPDLPCLRVDGSHTRLHAGLGGRWTLLAEKSAATSASATVARDHLGADRMTELVPVDGEPEQALLVRPDGHIGWQGAPNPRELGRWLDCVLRCGRAR
jgi:4,5-epoxidase